MMEEEVELKWVGMVLWKYGNMEGEIMEKVVMGR